MKKRFLALFLCMMLVFVTAACGQKKTEKKDDTRINLYYTNEDCDTLIAEKHDKSTKKKVRDQAEETIGWLSDQSEMSEDEFASIPSEVVINSIDVKKRIARIDFAVGYEKLNQEDNLNKKEDLICRAAITKTLTQIEGIDYVEFSIGGTTMTDTDGTPIGALNSDSFLFGDLPMEDDEAKY